MATIKTDNLYTGNDLKVTDGMKRNFKEEGYILVRKLFSKEEIGNLRKVFEESDIVENHGLASDDGTGKLLKMLVWGHPGNDVSGVIARSEKVVNTAEQLLGDEVYHYHGKLLYKEPLTGGRIIWHQDYGYWYDNGCMFPDMLTVFVAIDRCTKNNGCLQILPGSHKCGRIEHLPTFGQTAAEEKRVADIEKVCPKVYVEMEAGDALFFHCNVLHASAVNESPDRRWAYLIAYNTKRNNPIKEHHHPCYTPLVKVPNSAILECTNFSDFSGKDFMVPKDVASSQAVLKKDQE